MAVTAGLLAPLPAFAQPPTGGAAIVCESKDGARQVCPGDTSGGVVLIKSIGTAACLLGKTWGYDAASVWVTDGCGGEFRFSQAEVIADISNALGGNPNAAKAK